MKIVVIIPDDDAPTLEDALDRALESRSANVLADVEVTWSYFYFPLVYVSECWTLEGKAYDLAR